MSDPQTNARIVQIKKQQDYGGGFSQEETRYAIADSSGVIIDDAQGYGYKSAKSASKAMWYKFKGGRSKMYSDKSATINYWRDKKKIAQKIFDALELNFKEISRDEITEEEIIDEIEKDSGMILDRHMVNNLLKYDGEIIK